MNITVVGTGYVGLVTGACFSEFGNHVTCVDKDVSKIEMLRRGQMPIYEPGLDDLVERNVKAGRLFFETDLPKAIRSSLVVFIAVGTPQGNDGRADLTFVREVAAQIAENGPLAVQAIKRSVIEGLSLSEKEALARELEIGWPIFASEDAKEGPRAFAEKRKPNFKGR